MIKRPSPRYCEWINHSYLFYSNINVLNLFDDCKTAKIVTHPAYPAVKIDLTQDIILQIYSYPKSTQMYFFSFVWACFIDLECPNSLQAASKIIVAILDYAIANPKYNTKEMIWDDQALSERACALLYLKEKKEIYFLEKQIEEHIEITNNNLKYILASKKWLRNNHRAFHLCANACLEKYFYHNQSTAYFFEIENYFRDILDFETGLALEQAVLYYNFNMSLFRIINIFVKTHYSSSSDLQTLYYKIIKNKNIHMRALAFPDGQLPASGDTPLGLVDKSPNLDFHTRKSAWKNLERIGHFRGCSENGVFHYHVLTHNAESAHGHRSPLHIDLWIRDFGSVIVDSGGPYLYGNPFREEYFKDYKAHNTIAFEAPIKNEEVVLVKNELTQLCGIYYAGKSVLKRQIEAHSDQFIIHDNILANESWDINLNLNEKIRIFQTCINSFNLISEKGKVDLSISMPNNCKLENTQGWLTYAAGEKRNTTNIKVSGDRGFYSLKFIFKFTSVRL